MPPVYLDGVKLRSAHARLLINIMGNLDEICPNCGGSMIEVKGIVLHTSDKPTIFHTWCSTCGRFVSISQQSQVTYLKEVISRVASEVSLDG